MVAVSIPMVCFLLDMELRYPPLAIRLHRKALSAGQAIGLVLFNIESNRENGS
jgi:hypothetical protein